MKKIKQSNGNFKLDKQMMGHGCLSVSVIDIN